MLRIKSLSCRNWMRALVEVLVFNLIMGNSIRCYGKGLQYNVFKITSNYNSKVRFFSFLEKRVYYGATSYQKSLHNLYQYQ